MADVQQRRSGLFGAGQLGRRDRRRLVVGRGGERPLHDRLAVEAGRPVARRRRRRPAANGDGGAHEVLWADQLDAEALECGRCLFEELVGRLDVELDGCGPVDARRAGRARRRWRGDRRGQLAHHRFEQGEVLRAGGHLDGERVARPHVGGAAPPPGIGLVDELEIDTPRVEAVVGDDETQAPDEHRLAAGPVGRGGGGLSATLAEGVGVDGPCRLDAGVLTGEGTEHEPDDGGRRRAIPRDDRVPAGALQAAAGGVVDEALEDRADDLPAGDRGRRRRRPAGRSVASPRPGRRGRCRSPGRWLATSAPRRRRSGHRRKRLCAES